MGNPAQAVNSVKRLDAKYPKLISIYPAILYGRGDDRLSLSTRVNALYRYILLSERYSVMSENGNIFFLRTDVKHQLTEDEIKIIDPILLYRSLEFVPDAFGSSIDRLKKRLTKSDIMFKVDKLSPTHIKIVFDKPIAMRNLDFLYFVNNDKSKINTYTITLDNNTISSSLVFSSRSDKKLIPLDALASFLLAKDITAIDIKSKSYLSVTDIMLYENKVNNENKFLRGGDNNNE